MTREPSPAPESGKYFPARRRIHPGHGSEDAPSAELVGRAPTTSDKDKGHKHLKRREIWPGASTRWRNPQAQLLAGQA